MLNEINVEIALPLGFILLVVILLVYCQIIGPRRRIQRFKEEMATQGWREYLKVARKLAEN